MAAITVDLESITAVADCEGNGNPGDFQFRIVFTDQRNQPLGTVVELPDGDHGTSPGNGDVLQLPDGGTYPVDRQVTFMLPEETGSAFTIAMSMIEQDQDGPDARADDVTRFNTYVFEDGRFQGIVGQQTLDVYEPGPNNFNECRTRLAYTISIS